MKTIALKKPRSLQLLSALAAAALLAAILATPSLAAPDLPTAGLSSSPAVRGGDLGAAPGVTAQGPAFGEEIDVRVVNVEAVVTDKKGNRVTGLAPGDFRLWVDGAAMPIDYFTEIQDGKVGRAGQVGSPGAAGEPPQGIAGLAPGEPVGTSYLVFVDDRFTIQAYRNTVLRNLADGLSSLGPEDRMAIVAYDGRKLALLSGWSSSLADLKAAIGREIASPARGLEASFALHPSFTTDSLGAALGGQRGFDDFPFPPRFTGFDPARSIAGSSFYDSVTTQWRITAGRLAQDVERVADAATSAMRGFAFAPGRKALLLLAGNWPNPHVFLGGGALGWPAYLLQPDAWGGTSGGAFKPVVETANLLGYTIYPVDVQVDGTGFGRASFAGVLEKTYYQDSLRLLASTTGGRALFKERFKALPEVAADTRSYYWLGFAPGWQGNDKRHEIRLEVLRPGLQARARNSFLDLSPAVRTSLTVESAMFFGAPSSSAAMPLHLGTAVRSGWDRMLVPVALDIPVDAITMVPRDGKFTTQVEIRILAQDARGIRSDIPSVPVAFTAPQPPGKGQFLRYDAQLRLRRTRQHITFAVFDPQTSRTTITEADYTP